MEKSVVKPTKEVQMVGPVIEREVDTDLGRYIKNTTF